MKYVQCSVNMCVCVCLSLSLGSVNFKLPGREGERERGGYGSQAVIMERTGSILAAAEEGNIFQS